MNNSKAFDSVGKLIPVFVQKRSLLFHYQFDVLRLLDFNNLEELSRVVFKNPIVNIFVVYDPDLEFLVLTEDNYAHHSYLDGWALKTKSSIKIEENIMQEMALLYDNESNLCIFFENGHVYRLSKKNPFDLVLDWPQSTGFKINSIFMAYPSEKFKNFSYRTSGFITFQTNTEGTLICTYFIDFEQKTIKDGPYKIQISPHSQCISPMFFAQYKKAFKIDPYTSVGSIDDIYISSGYYGDVAYVVSENSGVYCLSSQGVNKITQLNCIPIRIETNGSQFVYITNDGFLVSQSTGAKIDLSSFIRLSENNALLIRSESGQTSAFPMYPCPKIGEPRSLVHVESVESHSGSLWKAPHKIVCHSFCVTDKGEIIIVSTSGSVHIIEINNQGNAECIFDKKWDSGIMAVAVSEKHFAVASVDNRIHVSSYHPDEKYSFTFQSVLCISLSLSTSTLAAGFCDGSFICASLVERGPLFTSKCFRIPITKVVNITDTSVLVCWGEAHAIVSPNSLQWVKLPVYPDSIVSTLSSGLIMIGRQSSVEIYNFASKSLLAQIPHRSIGVCSNGRRFFILTCNNELIVLYYHREISVDHQCILSIENPCGIAAVDETVYVICEKYIAVFDMRGHRIDTIEIITPVRYFESSPCGLYVCFSRMVWFISRDQSMKKIPHEKSNITGFTAIDDDRFCISTPNRLLVCLSKENRVSFSTIAKIEKKVRGIQSVSSKHDTEKDTIVCIMEDKTIETFLLPQGK